MATNDQVKQQYQFTPLRSYSGSRISIKIKQGEGPNGKFIALELGGELDAREVQQIETQAKKGGRVYCNFNTYRVSDLQADLDMMRKALEYAQAADRKLDEASLANL